MNALKKTRNEKENGICGGMGAAHTPTYAPLPLWSGLFSVDSFDLNCSGTNDGDLKSLTTQALRPGYHRWCTVPQFIESAHLTIGIPRTTILIAKRIGCIGRTIHNIQEVGAIAYSRFDQITQTHRWRRGIPTDRYTGTAPVRLHTG